MAGFPVALPAISSLRPLQLESRMHKVNPADGMLGANRVLLWLATSVPVVDAQINGNGSSTCFFRGDGL